MRFFSSRLFISAVLVLLAVVITIAAASYLLAGHLKQELRTTLEKTLNAQVEIQGSLWMSIRFDADHTWPLHLEFIAEDIRLAQDDPVAVWHRATVEQATASFPLTEILHNDIPLSVDLHGWTLELASPTTLNPASISSPSSETSGSPSLPAGQNKFDLSTISAQDGTIYIPISDTMRLQLAQLTLHAQHHAADESWWIQAQAQTLSSPYSNQVTFGPLVAEATVQQDQLNLTSVDLTCGPGQLHLQGTADLSAPHTCHLQYTANSLPLEQILPPTWSGQVAGQIKGQGQFDSSDTNKLAVGKFSIDQAQVKFLSFFHLPILQLPDFGTVELDRATGSYLWTPEQLTLNELDFEKSGIVRLIGQGIVKSDRTIDAQLKLGLPVGLFLVAPQVQTAFFPEMTDGYALAPVHITGTLDHPQDDLTPKLTAAGITAGTNLLQNTATQATNAADSVSKTANNFLNNIFSAPMPSNPKIPNTTLITNAPPATTAPVTNSAPPSQ